MATAPEGVDQSELTVVARRVLLDGLTAFSPRRLEPLLGSRRFVELCRVSGPQTAVVEQRNMIIMSTLQSCAR